jgi:hypothetical protein
MPIETPRVKQISFKQQEYPLLIQQQKDLQKIYRMDISGLYKYLLREKHQELFGVPVAGVNAPQEVMP